MQNSAPALIRLSIGVLAARDSERKVRHCCHCSQLSLLSLSLSVSQCNVASVVKPWTWRNTSRDELIWHVGHVVNIWTWESVSVSQSVNVRCELSWHLTPYLMCYGSQLPTLNSQLLAQTDYWDRLSQCSVHCSCCRVQLAQLADYWLFPRNDDEDSVFWFLGLRWWWWWFWQWWRRWPRRWPRRQSAERPLTGQEPSRVEGLRHWRVRPEILKWRPLWNSFRFSIPRCCLWGFRGWWKGYPMVFHWRRREEGKGHPTISAVQTNSAFHCGSLQTENLQGGPISTCKR